MGWFGACALFSLHSPRVSIAAQGGRFSSLSSLYFSGTDSVCPSRSRILTPSFPLSIAFRLYMYNRNGQRNSSAVPLRSVPGILPRCAQSLGSPSPSAPPITTRASPTSSGSSSVSILISSSPSSAGVSTAAASSLCST